MDFACGESLARHVFERLPIGTLGFRRDERCGRITFPDTAHAKSRLRRGELIGVGIVAGAWGRLRIADAIDPIGEAALVSEIEAKEGVIPLAFQHIGGRFVGNAVDVDDRASSTSRRRGVGPCRNGPHARRAGGFAG